MKSEELPEVEQPYNLEDCFRILKDIMDRAELLMFKDYLEGNAIAITHHYLGRYLRNNWYLNWSKELAAETKDKGYPQEMPLIVEWFNNDYDITNPDDMSSIILRSFHRKLNNKPLDIAGQVKQYKTHGLG
jgi:hypothetical protein